MREDHPIDLLVVTVEGDTPPPVADAVRAAARQLAGRRSWVVGPPELFEEPGRLLGFVLQVYSALPPWGAELDRDVDRAELAEVKELLGEACRISAEQQVSFDVELTGESIGTISSGRMDHSLEVGLIGEWERTLNDEGSGPGPRQP